MKRFLIIVSAALAFYVTTTHCFPAETKERLVTDHFIVEYDEVGRNYAAIVSNAAENSFAAIAQRLGHKPAKPITIILAADDRQFDRLTEHALPDWSAAAALSSDTIVISPLKGRKIGVERIIAHEIAHCIINDAALDVFVPRWFHEGCAESVSGDIGVRGTVYIIVKAVRDELMSFEDIERVFSSGPDDATLAYDQSLLAVNYLMSMNGRDVIGQIVSVLSESGSFDKAFLEASGVTLTEFQTSYLAYVRQTYGWRAVVIFVPGTWTIILALAFIVYAVKKYRNRQKMKEWETSSRPQNVIDFEPPPPDDFMDE